MAVKKRNSDFVGEKATRGKDIDPVDWSVQAPIETEDGHLEVTVTLRAHDAESPKASRDGEIIILGSSTSRSHFRFRKKEILELIPDEYRSNPFALVNAIGKIADLKDNLNKQLKEAVMTEFKNWKFKNNSVKYRTALELLENEEIVKFNGLRTRKQKSDNYYIWLLEQIAKLETLMYLERQPVSFQGGRY